jgi:hypothetical protein
MRRPSINTAMSLMSSATSSLRRSEAEQQQGAVAAAAQRRPAGGGHCLHGGGGGGGDAPLLDAMHPPDAAQQVVDGGLAGVEAMPGQSVPTVTGVAGSGSTCIDRHQSAEFRRG